MKGRNPGGAGPRGAVGEVSPSEAAVDSEAGDEGAGVETAASSEDDSSGVVQAPISPSGSRAITRPFEDPDAETGRVDDPSSAQVSVNDLHETSSASRAFEISETTAVDGTPVDESGATRDPSAPLKKRLTPGSGRIAALWKKSRSGKVLAGESAPAEGAPATDPPPSSSAVSSEASVEKVAPLSALQLASGTDRIVATPATPAGGVPTAAPAVSMPQAKNSAFAATLIGVPEVAAEIRRHVESQRLVLRAASAPAPASPAEEASAGMFHGELDPARRSRHAAEPTRPKLGRGRRLAIVFGVAAVVVVAGIAITRPRQADDTDGDDQRAGMGAAPSSATPTPPPTSAPARAAESAPTTAPSPSAAAAPGEAPAAPTPGAAAPATAKPATTTAEPATTTAEPATPNGAGVAAPVAPSPDRAQVPTAAPRARAPFDEPTRAASPDERFGQAPSAIERNVDRRRAEASDGEPHKASRKSKRRPPEPRAARPEPREPKPSAPVVRPTAKGSPSQVGDSDPDAVLPLSRP